MPNTAFRRGTLLMVAFAALALHGDDSTSPVRCEVFGGIAIPPEVVIQWDPLVLPVVIISIQIHRDGEIVAELPPDALEYVEEPSSGVHEYEVWMFPSPDEGFLHGRCTVEYEPPRIGGFLRGDANADGARDITDAITILRSLFIGGTVLKCDRSADTDDSGLIEITDAIYLLHYLFLGGSPPPAPFDECDYDRTEDFLDCVEFPPCHEPPPP